MKADRKWSVARIWKLLKGILLDCPTVVKVFPPPQNRPSAAGRNATVEDGPRPKVLTVLNISDY